MDISSPIPHVRDWLGFRFHQLILKAGAQSDTVTRHSHPLQKKVILADYKDINSHII